MARRQLFEFEDFAWYPRRLRDFETDLLRFVLTRTPLYDRVAPLLAELLPPGPVHVLDLCSGGSGPWPRLRGMLESVRGAPVRVTLSDRFPNLPAFEHVASAGIEFVREPVDATAVPPDLKGDVRTIFSAFHHLPDSLARDVLRDARDRRVPIFVFEGTERSAAGILGMLPVPLVALALAPFLRPFSLPRLLFTYIVPIVPLVGLWDGIASAIRTRDENEMRALCQGLETDGWEWRVGRFPGALSGGMLVPPLMWLAGRPTCPT